MTFWRLLSPKCMMSLAFVILPIKSAREGEGCGENGEWVSSGVGAALGICPHQGHQTPLFTAGSVPHSASQGNRVDLSALSFLRHCSFWAPGTPHSGSLVLPFSRWISTYWRPRTLFMLLLPQEVCFSAQALSIISMLMPLILPAPLSSTCTYSEVPRGCVPGLQT